MKLKCLATGSSGNCYILSNGNESLIIDCGIPIAEIKKGLDYNIKNIVGVIVSHGHADHSKSVDKLSRMGIPIYAPYINRKKVIHFGGFTIRGFELPHNETDNYGFLITVDDQKILYLTDFEYCEYNFKKLNIDHIIVECNYQQELVNTDLPNYEHKIKGHCSLETCKEFIKANYTNNLKSILLVHMGGWTCDEKQCVSEIEDAAFDVTVDYARPNFEMELHGNNWCPFDL